MPRKYLDVDLARVYETPDSKSVIHILAWGDAVEVVGGDDDATEIRFNGKPAWIKGGEELFAATTNVLKVDFVDVQQGDGAVVETPRGKVVLIDGGDNQLFARYLAARFRRTSADKPKEIDAIVVSHGDADHFLGLAEIAASETHATPAKRLFIRLKRLFHNGLIKRPSSYPDAEQLGKTVTIDKKTYVTGLETDVLKFDSNEMNVPFKKWQTALAHWSKRGKIHQRRLEKGDDKAFDFLTDEGIKMEVLGPITETVKGKPALRFLGKPPKGPRVGHESLSLGEEGFKGLDPGHTINGHSITLRMSYGQFTFLFTGDLNDESARILAREHNDNTLSLRSEVLKVPHHGSADFSGAFIQAVSPIVSIVSSGDESTRKEYIHPRATIMGALGKYSRIEEPLIFVTELVAFFSMVGPVMPECHEEKNGQLVPLKKQPKAFFAFERTAYGIVKIRTDGERLLVFTNSGLVKMKEAYAYQMDEWGKPTPVEVSLV